MIALFVFIGVWFVSFICLCFEYDNRGIPPGGWPILTTLIPVLNTYLWLYLFLKRIRKGEFRLFGSLFDFIRELNSD